jgi:hypothetical protein
MNGLNQNTALQNWRAVPWRRGAAICMMDCCYIILQVLLR